MTQKIQTLLINKVFGHIGIFGKVQWRLGPRKMLVSSRGGVGWVGAYQFPYSRFFPDSTPSAQFWSLFAFSPSPRGWPTTLAGPGRGCLAFLTESGLLKSLKVREAIVTFEKQTEVWLPDSRDQACSVIGKFTQGSKADGKRLTRRRDPRRRP